MKYESPQVFRVLGVWALLVVVPLHSGCSLLLREADEMVAKNFPPLSHADAKAEAIRQSNNQLTQLSTPGLLLNVPPQTIQEALAEALRTIPNDEIRVLSATVVPDEQGLAVTAEIAGVIAEPKGTFRARLHGWSVVQIVEQTASVQPVLESAELTSLSLDKWWTPDRLIVKAINGVVRRYMDNVNGQIKPLEYAVKQRDTGLPSQPVPIKLQDGTFVTIPAVELGATAVLIDSDGLHLMTQINVQDDPTVPVTTPAPPTFSAYRTAFWQKAASVRRDSPQAQPGLFVSNSLLDRLLVPSFKPVSMKDLEKVALAQTIFALGIIGDVTAGVVISPKTLTDAIFAALKANLTDTDETTFGDPAVLLGEQSIMLTLPVKGIIKGSNLRYTGVLQGGGILGFNEGKLTYRIVLGGISLNYVEHLGGPIAVEPFIGSINAFVAQILPYINAAMVQKPIELPLPDIKPIAMSNETVTIEPAELVPARPGPLLLLPRLSPLGLKVMVMEASELPSSLFRYDLTLPDAFIDAAIKPDVPNIPVTALVNGGWSQPVKEPHRTAEQESPKALVEVSTPEQVEDAFRQRWESALPPYAEPGPGRPEIQGTVSIRWVLSMINRTLKNNNLSIRAEFDSGKIPYNTGEIKLLNELVAKCVTDVECRRDSSCPLDNNCSRDRCSYGCRRCAFGMCTDDPFCKASEAACNIREETKRGICNAAAETRRGLCNTEQEARLAACNVRREAERFGCNIVNEAIRAINKLNSIGAVSGDAQIHARALVTEPSLSYDPATGAMWLSLIPSVQLAAQGDVHFQPYDIGHVLVCPAPGTVPFNFSGNLMGHPTNIVAHLTEQPSDSIGNIELGVSFDPVTITGQLSPGPLEALLVQNPQIFITCNPMLTGALGSATVIGKVSAFGPADILGAIEKAIPYNQEEDFSMASAITSGKIDYKLEPEPMSVDIPGVKATLMGQTIELTPHWKDGQIMLVH